MYYCLGFAFNKTKDKVALIEKTKPEWQKGLLNGIGGKVEKDESSYDAMQREFYEETGFYIKNWDYIGSMTGSPEMLERSWTVDVYTAFDIDLSKLKSTTEEQVVITDIQDISINPLKYISNLHWLIGYALDKAISPNLRSFNVYYDF